MKKIALCGTPEFVIKFFDQIKSSKRYSIEFCITQNAKQKGRGKSIQKSPVAVWAKKHNIKYFEVEKTSDKNDMLIEELKKLDCVLLFAFGKIIPKSWLELPKNGWLNIHPSNLPQLRGPSPIQYAFLNQLKETAVTLMCIDAKMDEGDIIAQKTIKITENHTANSLLFEICMKTPKWIEEKIYQFLSGKITSVPQQKDATYSKMIKKEDHIIKDASAQEIIAKIKGLGFVYLNINDVQVKCSCADLSNNNSLFIINGITPIYVQAPGKKIMYIKNFLNGMKIN